MNSLAFMAMNMLQNSPEIKNDPAKMEMLDCIKTGNDARGKQIAEELCSKHGDTPQTVLMKAKQLFGLK